MSRQATDGGSVLSFTFLDVLMCTMGSLLLLLVVFGVIARKSTRARREGEESRISLAALADPSAPAPAAEVTDPNAANSTAPGEAPDADVLAEQLEKVRSEQAELERLRGAAAERRREEEARIAHLEDHERRLEHDLAKLHITLQALQAAEEKQIVDDQQAEAEASRLKDLIRETEERLEDMRKNGSGDKAYAIVPYKGANGTFRRPVFVECTADAVTIQPEGIRLTVEDFDGPLRSGNPLAAAVRAAHEELNGRAVAAGQAEMPDPYPLLIVRPDGAAAYAAALDAIRSWDSDYGYEFVEADWTLKYSEPDPRLAQVMAHAVDEARQRQALLARVAPRRYGPRLAVGGVGGGGAGDGLGGDGAVGIGSEGGSGGGFESLAGGAGDRIGQHGGDGAFGDGAGGNPLRGGAGGGNGNFMDEFGAGGQMPGGALTTNGAGGNGPGGSGSSAMQSGQLTGTETVGAAGPNGSNGPNGGTTGESADSTPPYGAPPQNGGAGSAAGAAGAAGQFASGGGGAQGTTGSASQSGGGAGATGSTNGSSGGSNTTAMAGGGGAGGSGSPGGTPNPTEGAATISAGSSGLPPMQTANRRRSSAAETRGINWANVEAKRNAAAITRPIKIQVNAEQLVVLDADGRPADDGSISFRQPVDGVMDGLGAAIQRQIADWGLAGDRMYWRPTLVVSVTPGAERQAERLAELMENSGVDVRLPQATATAPGGTGHATR